MFMDEEVVSGRDWAIGRNIASVKQRIDCSMSSGSLDDMKREPVPNVRQWV